MIRYPGIRLLIVAGRSRIAGIGDEPKRTLSRRLLNQAKRASSGECLKIATGSVHRSSALPDTAAETVWGHRKQSRAMGQHGRDQIERGLAVSASSRVWT